jgi:polyphosphate kinase 2
VIVIFEGRDAAGKGGAIRRLTENLPPREVRVVALPKPNEVEQGQWYFQRYINLFPCEGEIVFFDRSWYNRAIVEPVNGFCTHQQYLNFMDMVNDVERMMLLSGIHIVKLYFSISKKEQERRFKEIMSSPIKKWKFSEVDKKALGLWDEYTKYKELMFKNTQEHVTWKVLKANRKTSARIRALEYILNKIPYETKDKENIRHQAMLKDE